MKNWTQRPRWTFVLSTVIALIVALVCRHYQVFDDGSGVSHAANVFATTDWLVMESLDILLNKMAIGQYFNMDDNDQFEQAFAVGPTIRKKLPQRFLTRDGLGYNPQGLNRITTTISVNQVFGIDFEWDSYEKAVNMERGEAQLRKEYIEPAMAQLTQEIESRCALWAYQNASAMVGILGTDPTDFDSSSASCRQKLVELGCPVGKDRCMVVTPSIMRTLKKSAVSYFNPVTDISKQFRTGIVGSGDGFEWYESVSLYSHTAGTWAGAVTVKGAGQSGSSLTITATAGDTFKRGDKFSMANVNSVNPGTRRKVGAAAKTFTVLNDPQLTAAGGGVDVLSISPAIFGPGSQYQNVDALPADAATLTLWPGTAAPNGKSGTISLALHPDGFALVGLPLEVPKAAEVGVMKRDPETGIAVAFVRMFDPIQRKMVNRFDILLGFGNYYSDNCAVALAGA